MPWSVLLYIITYTDSVVIIIGNYVAFLFIFEIKAISQSSFLYFPLDGALIPLKRRQLGWSSNKSRSKNNKMLISVFGLNMQYICTLYNVIIRISLNIISNRAFISLNVKVISNIFRWHFYLFPSIISKHLYLAAIDKRLIFFLPLVSHFCVHHLPPQLSPERLGHAQREHQNMEQRLRGLQQRPWWGGGGHDIWGAGPRWRGRWDDGPERPSLGAVCMQRPWGRVRGGRRQGGELGGALGVTLHCFVFRCLLVESSCWMCHRIEEWKPSHEQQVHDVIGMIGSWHALLDAAFCSCAIIC